jgi:hypothetical protein
VTSSPATRIYTGYCSGALTLHIQFIQPGAALLERLRDYWLYYHPRLWLFPRRDMQLALNTTTPQKVFTRAKRRAGIDKVGGIHSLRHAYATHQNPHAVLTPHSQGKYRHGAGCTGS